MKQKGFFDREDRVSLTDSIRIREINSYIDSVRSIVTEPEYAPEPFNPNFMSDHKGYRFGMTPEEIDRLFAFRASGNFISNTKQFQEVTGVHDSVLINMEPYFRFPRFPERKLAAGKVLYKQDINTASALALEEVYGIGPVLAERIVTYRERLGGFAVEDQLGEVYGLKDEVVAALWQRFHLNTPVVYEQLNINTADLEELAAVPYVSMSLASKIVAYRSVRQQIDSLAELKKIHDLTEKDLSRIQLYLVVE